jgi:hypothetical protein
MNVQLAHAVVLQTISIFEEKSMIRKLLLAGVVASALGSIAVPASAQIYVQVAPPAPMHEVVPAPRAGYVWAPGYYDWRNNRHVWVAGHWVAERPGYAYMTPRWVERDGRWYMERRGWTQARRGGRDNDGDGVPNRFDARPNNPNVTLGSARRDSDGDGVADRFDNRPNNPNRQ